MRAGDGYQQPPERTQRGRWRRFFRLTVQDQGHREIIAERAAHRRESPEQRYGIGEFVLAFPECACNLLLCYCTVLLMRWAGNGTLHGVVRRADLYHGAE